MSTDMLNQVARTAERYLGRMEVGTNRGEWVDSLNRRMNAPLGSPWCASFACGCVLEVQDRFNVKTYLQVSPSVRFLWLDNKPAQKPFPEIGYIVCWGYRGTPNGHCGIVVSVDPKGEWFETIEGNTDNKATIEREGGMVVRNRRPMKLPDQSVFVLLGFLRTF